MIVFQSPVAVLWYAPMFRYRKIYHLPQKFMDTPGTGLARENLNLYKTGTVSEKYKQLWTCDKVGKIVLQWVLREHLNSMVLKAVLLAMK